MNEIFKANLRRAIAYRKTTQQALARDLNVSNRTVAGWCLGEALPQPRLRADLSRKLRLPEAWFFQVDAELPDERQAA